MVLHSWVGAVLDQAASEAHSEAMTIDLNDENMSQSSVWTRQCFALELYKLGHTLSSPRDKTLLRTFL